MTFVDIRGFTTWCERHTAAEALSLLNEFFGIVVPRIADHGGHTNKFLGDGLLAGFGTPDAMAEHADRAVRSALAVAAAVDERFGDELRIGIGLNTGPLIVGTLGGGGRLELGLTGDPVNVAARVEQLTKETGDTILASETTIAALVDRDHLGTPRGFIDVRGKANPIRIYALGPSADREFRGQLDLSQDS